MIDVYFWLAAVAAFPLAVVLVSYADIPVDRLRGFAVWCSAGLLAIASLTLVVPDALSFAIFWRFGLHPLLGASAFRLSALSTVLIPFAAALWLLTVAATPRSRLDRGGLRRTAATTFVTIASFLTESPALLVALWIGSVALYRSGLAATRHSHTRRVVTAYLGVSIVLLAAGVVLIAYSETPGARWESAGLWLVAFAALIRKGIFPFHAWIPEAFDAGRMGPATMFCAPQLGAYVMVVIVVPRASPELLSTVVVLALVTAVYGAMLTLTQRSVRRACGYLFVSQSALVMAGLDCVNESALAGSLVLWLSSGLAFAGLARCVLVLEGRRGRMDLSRFHGGHERMPILATSFLFMGLACAGFPGTLGFVGGELLLGGTVETSPILGICVIVAGALTGLAVLRMYYSLFCGRRDDGIHLKLLRREAFAFAAVAVFLIGAGLFPRPIVTSRFQASERLLRTRAATMMFPQVSEDRGDGDHKPPETD